MALLWLQLLWLLLLLLLLLTLLRLRRQRLRRRRIFLLMLLLLLLLLLLCRVLVAEGIRPGGPPPVVAPAAREQVRAHLVHPPAVRRGPRPALHAAAIPQLLPNQLWRPTAGCPCRSCSGLSCCLPRRCSSTATTNYAPGCSPALPTNAS